jgi:hypothetical protein
MADGYIQVYPDSTGKRIDASELTVNALTVERQRMALADNTGAANVAAVVAPYTQGGFGLAVQRFQDAGRAYWSFSWDAVAGVTSEALVSGVANLAGTNAGSATSYTVTTGKKLRLMGIAVDATGSAAGNVKLMVRSAAPALAITSPLLFRCQLGVSAANVFDHVDQQWPEGIEIAAGQAIGISQLASATTMSTTVTLNGFEY